MLELHGALILEKMGVCLMTLSEIRGSCLVSIEPLSEDERRQICDARWARHDPEVQTKYAGQFVVPYGRKIVAHGKDAAAVLAQAARVTGCAERQLPLCGIDDPLQELSS